MLVTEIKKQKKRLCEVTLHTGRVLLLDAEYCAEKGITAGSELSEADIEKHIAGSDYKRALSRGVWYIERGSISRKKLLEKFKAAGFREDSSLKAADRLEELGLINDYEYALRLSELYLASCISKKDALYKMMSKGIPRDTAKAALDEFECDAVAQIRSIINKKYREKMADELSSKKVFAALQRKGFSYGDIKEAFKIYNEMDYGEENGI
ncbi:MAG: RecX family transcriptional regulator [Clostridiales bacterium]|nr:RecX family transcriptional regulator [Candidatus Equinaster intestinalis]